MTDLTDNEQALVREALDTINGGTLRPLSPWEERFIESITDQFEDRAWLSERQIEILQRIGEEKA